MEVTTADRRHRRTASTALALFVAVWLNMAIQPCLMAAEPLLPAGHAHGDCPHCPETDHCGDDARCTYIDGYAFDAREPAAPDLKPALAPLIVTVPAGLPAIGDPVRGPPIAPERLDPGPPRYLAHCRFLN
jgi:hypothetical protein